MNKLFDQGRELIAKRKREALSRKYDNFRSGRAEVRRSFVFSFYHDTMTKTHLANAYHEYGPDSPDPDIQPVGGYDTIGTLGGQYHVPWEWEWDGLHWRADWDWGLESYRIQLYVRVKQQIDTGSFRDWLITHIHRALRGKQWVPVYSAESIARWEGELA